MAFDFPASPTTGQLFTPAGGGTYVWSGYAWDAAPSSASDIFLTKLDKLRLAVGGNWSFTENDLRVTKIGGGGSYDPVFSQPATQMHDYLYFEATIMLKHAAGGIFIGIASKNMSYSAGQYPGVNTWGAGFHSNGSYYYNSGNSGAGTYPAFTTGDTIALAVAVPFGYMWIRNITTNSFWNASASFNPASSPPTNGGAGGAFIYNMGSIAAVAAMYAVTESVRFNFDGTFLGPVPAGYRRWRGVP